MRSASAEFCQNITTIQYEVIGSIILELIAGIFSIEDDITLFHQLLQLLIITYRNNSSTAWFFLGRVGNDNTRGSFFFWDKSGGYLFTDQAASGVEVA